MAEFSKRQQDAAYRAAEHAIEEARAEAATELNLSAVRANRSGSGPRVVKTDFAALTRLPDQISSLTSLQTLRLDDTRVSDLAPLAALTSLQILHLNQTQVSDLAPLAALTGLIVLTLRETQVSDIGPLSELTRLQLLTLDGSQVSHIAPLAALTGLERLSLTDTQISDLAPIAALTGLQNLTLSNCPVRDLRPLLDLTKLGTEGFPGLAFADTPATRADPALHNLSQINDHEERAEKTRAYLATLPPWPEPLDGPAAIDPPDQDPGLPLVWGPDGFAFLAAKVDTDPVTEDALEDLRSLLDDLRRKGNRHDDLFRLAGEMQDRSAGPIADLNLVRLHLSYQKLRRLYQGREARTEGFDDETVSVLGAVLEIVPGVTMADSGVKLLIERQEADRTRPSAPDVAAAEDAVLAAVHADDAPFAPEVKDIAGAIRQPGFDDRLAATRGILSRNAAVVVLKYLGNVTVAGIIGNYAYTHMPEILALARTMGDDAFTWAQMVFASFKVEYEASVGILRETVASGAIRPKRKPPKDVNEP